MSDESFRVPIDDPQPTQYCLSAGKLRGVVAWFDFDNLEYDPLPVARADEDGEWLLLDGHTRAVCALLAGETELRVRDATADDDVDLDVYRTCRDWCGDRDVERVRDLVGETWSAERYEREWLGRCEAAFGDA